MNDPNELKKSVDAFACFFSEFGPMDVYSRVMWEEIFKELMGIHSDDDEEKKDGDDNN